MRIAHPAEIATDIANDHADIPTLVLIAHSVHLCSTVLAAQPTYAITSRTSDTLLRVHAGRRGPSPAHCSPCCRKIKGLLYRSDNTGGSFLYNSYKSGRASRQGGLEGLRPSKNLFFLVVVAG